QFVQNNLLINVKPPWLETAQGVIGGKASTIGSAIGGHSEEPKILALPAQGQTALKANQSGARIALDADSVDRLFATSEFAPHDLTLSLAYLKLTRRVS